MKYVHIEGICSYLHDKERNDFIKYHYIHTVLQAETIKPKFIFMFIFSKRLKKIKTYANGGALTLHY